MSNLLSTTAMIAECKRRVPIGLDSPFWLRKLNESFRDISQKGAFVWNERSSSLTLPAGVVWFDIPATADVGRPMFLSGPSSGPGSTEGTINSPIPRIEWEEATNQQWSEMDVSPGAFSAWALTTVISGATYAYKGYLFPFSAVAVGELTFGLTYHVDVASTELADGANVYFPTPNAFDGFYIDFAEAEARRIYGLAGWEVIQKKAEAAILPLLDSYRSQKHSPIGLVDQQKQTSERKMMAQERS